jgi:broad specificity phosphatase PhoE
MPSLYLIRHGQAGSRDDYDLLSGLGKQQATALGRYLRGLNVRFDAAYSGDLVRQRETSRHVLGELDTAPDVSIDPRWNEFDLAGLWKGIAPRLLEESETFQRNYELFHRDNAAAERVITTCDVELIQAWMKNHYACDGLEPWTDFRKRVLEPVRDLSLHPDNSTVAVFTSATPIGIWAAESLGLEEQRTFRVVAVLLNSSYSRFALKGQQFTLLSLNNTGHLPEPHLNTYR